MEIAQQYASMPYLPRIRRARCIQGKCRAPCIKTVRIKYMSETNPYKGLFPGDYFIQRISIEGDIVHAYGFLRGEDHAGNIFADYQCSRPPTKEVRMDAESTKVVGRINVDAYKLAKIRGWPDEDEEVLAIIAYSGGRNRVATLWERLKIKFMSV